MTPDYVAQLIDDLVALFDPVVEAVDDVDSAAALLKDMGYQAPSDVAFLNDFSTTLAAFMDVAAQTDTLLRVDTDPDYLALFRSLITAIQDTVKLIRDIGGTLQTNFSADFLTATNMVEQFPRQLWDYLLVRMIERQYPVLHSSLVLVGIIDEGEVTTAATPFNTPYTKRAIRWEKLRDYINSPLSSMQEAYGWNTDNFDYDGLIGNVHSFAQSVRFFSCLANPAPATLQALNGGVDVVTDDNASTLGILKFPLLPVLDASIGFEIYPVLNTTKDKAVGLGIGLYFDPSGGLTFPLTDDLSLGVKYTGTAPLDAGVVVLPDRPLQPLSNVFGGTGPQVDLSSFIPEFVYTNSDQKTLLFDTSFGARLEFASWTVRGGALAGAGGFYVESDLKGVTLTFSGSQGDGFLQAFLPSEPMALDFDLTIGFSSERALYFGGSIDLAVKLPTHVNIGPITLQAVSITLKPANGGIPLILGADISGSIGPVEIVVENVGAAVTVSFPPNRDGNLGPLQVDLGFNPPSGAGLSIDAGGLTGGGFLDHDPAVGLYEGALAFTIGDIGLAAYGLIATKLPTGGSGFSALVVISTEFAPGIELPFGFTLDGVGGLLGIDRTIAMDAVESALWAHHFDNLLFPANPIAAAPALLTALDTFFPPARGRYLIGPLAKIGWGSIAEAVIGLFLELPEPLRVLLMGEVAVLVPREHSQLELHIDFAGGYDMGKQQAFFDASLHNSRIERYPIVGDLAFRYDWGNNPVLALAIGGFNPHFQPPANFPTLKRVGVAIGQSSVQLHSQAYFALTSNTLQFGANLELTAGSGDFNVHGFLGFDALCERSPLSFSFDLAAGVDLRAGTDVLASVHLDGHVLGPTPWHVAGDASVSLLFFDVSVHFDESWGDGAAATPPIDPVPDLLAALANRSSFGSMLPPTTRSVIAAASSPTDAQDAMLLDPAGMLRISQRVLPLGQSITRYSGVPLGKPLTLSLDGLSVFGAAVSAPAVADEEFALAQFEDLTDAEKLSMPSFTQLAGGVIIGDSAVDLGRGARPRATMTPFNYVTIIVDSQPPPREKPVYVLPLVNLLAMNGRATPAPRGMGRYAPPPGSVPTAMLAPERYVIAGAGDTKVRADLPTDGTKRGALAALAAYRAQNPTDAANLQVLLEQEAA